MKRIEQTLNKINASLVALGFDTKISLSNISDSCYIEASLFDATDEFVGELKVRISDHELPVTYYNNNPCDFEVGENNGYAVCGHNDWYKLIVIICEKFSLDVPAKIKRLVTIAKKSVKAETSNIIKVDDPKLEEAKSFLATHPELIGEIAKIEEKSGQKRRQARSKFNKKYRDLIDPALLRSLV